MIDILQKSVKSSVEDRLRSPLFGAFILSWVTWNWKIFYSTFFVETERLGSGRIYYIEKLLNDTGNSIVGPLLSTIVIIVVLPFLKIGAYWVEEKFKIWRNEIAKEFSDKQWIPPDRANKLRNDLKILEDQNEVIIDKNDLLIDTKESLQKEKIV